MRLPGRAPAEQRTWSEREIHDFIRIEVSTGQTMHVLNTSISGGELNAAVRDIAATAFAGFETQASQIGQQQQQQQAISSQQEAITRILADARAFVAQRHTEMQSAKSDMSAEVDALNVKLQDVVKFIESSNTRVAEVDEKLRAMIAWMRDNQLESVPSRVTAAEAKTIELAAIFDQRCRELTDGLAALQASGSTSGFGGFQGAVAAATRDRNVFDPRDYKRADLGSKPSVARWESGGETLRLCRHDRPQLEGDEGPLAGTLVPRAAL